MKWKSWAFAVGFSGTILSSLLWIILKKRKKITSNQSKQIVISPPDKPQQQKVTIFPTTPLILKREKQKQNITHNLKDKIVAIILIVISVCLVILWIARLVENLLLLPIPKLPNDLVNYPTVPVVVDPLNSPNSVSINAFSQLNSKEPRATLTLTINQIKNETSSEATLMGSFDLVIPPELLMKICDTKGQTDETTENYCKGKGFVFQQTKYQGLQLKPQYASESLNLSIFNALGFSGFSKTIPLNAFFLPFSSADLVHIQIPVTFSLISQGEAYPDDWYWGDTSISLNLPSQTYVYDSASNITFNLPTDIRVLASAGIGNMTIEIEQWKNLPSLDSDLTILATRSFPFWALVYLTTILITLAFLTFISHTLFASKKSREEPLQNVFLNTFLVILTVVAIRQILVPPDLQGFLTRLDLFLTFTGTVILGLILTKYAVGIWNSSAEYD